MLPSAIAVFASDVPGPEADQSSKFHTLAPVVALIAYTLYPW